MLKNAWLSFFISVMLPTSLVYAQQDYGKQKITDKEMISKSANNVKIFKEIILKLNGVLEETKKEKDIVKVNCLNEKLISAKALQKIAEQADKSLSIALRQQDIDRAMREYEKVLISSKKMNIIQAESEACTGRFIFSTELGEKVEGTDEGYNKDKQSVSTVEEMSTPTTSVSEPNVNPMDNTPPPPPVLDKISQP